MSSVLRGLIAGVGFAAAMLAGTAAQAQQINGSCVSYEFTEDDDLGTAEQPGEGREAFVLRDDARSFSDAQGNSPAGTLRLGAVIRVKIDAGRLVGATDEGVSNQLFYIDRADISCSQQVLVSPETGLERKAVIKIGTAVKGAGKPVVAYRNPELTGCENDSCRKLSRFALYFVAAETDRSVLLSETIRLAITNQPVIVGWVDKESVYEWPYSVALRPREDLADADGNKGLGTVCGYFSVEEAVADDPSRCQPILGGTDWYSIDTRMLVMKQHPGGIYETIAPLVGTAEEGTTTGASGQPVALNPTQIGDANTDVLLAFNRVDVFFLIDGTKSMTPYIDAIRGAGGRPGVIQQMLETLKAELDKGVTLRAGFRVFRDTNRPDKDSRGEGFPLPDQDCGTMSEQEAMQGLADFQDEVSKIKVTTDDNDDYPEDIYGGLEYALRDVQSCPDNQKIIIVVSDAGYDRAAQEARGVDVPDLNRFIRRMNGELYKNSYMFFLRPPLNEALQGNEKYMTAYKSFVDDVAAPVLTALDMTKEEPNTFFVQLSGSEYDGAGVAGTIVKATTDGAHPDAIGELIIDVRGGASLRDAIKRLRGDENFSDIPGYFWRLVERGACKDLGDACTQSTLQSVRPVFVKNDPEKITLDVWMTQNNFSDWEEFFKLALSSDSTGQDERLSFASGLEQALRTVIRQSPKDSGESFGEYMSRVGKLPVGFKSPLMAYSLLEIMDPTNVPGCEVRVLRDWLNATSQMFRIMQSGHDLPEYSTVAGGAATNCFNVSEKGKAVPILSSTVRAKPLPEKEHSLLRTGAFVPNYWIPQEYLP